MTRFLDGPAQGQTLMLRRAPFFLRAVQAGDGTWDALDMLEDEPAATERVVLYQMEGEPSWVHIRATQGRSGVYRGGAYRLAADPPAEATLRDRRRWRAWAMAEGPRRDRTVQPAEREEAG